MAMLESRPRETLQSKVNICKSDVKIGDYADSLNTNMNQPHCYTTEHILQKQIKYRYTHIYCIIETHTIAYC